MYKKLALIVLASSTLAGCPGPHKEGDWTKKCELYYSENGRSLSDCKARREAAKPSTNAPGVGLQEERLDTTTQRNDEGKGPVSN